MRREYSIDPITINGRIVKKLVIDPHMDKHADHISYDLIKKMIRQLDGGIFHSEKEFDGFSYFATILKMAGLYWYGFWKKVVYISALLPLIETGGSNEVSKNKGH